mmetsp:Transcript_24655/g.21884  ORF Transcript_24655/g.21884 Transcript_24655/m.21884 type:complete len:104 (+) Transcript_24655:120-431(+)
MNALGSETQDEKEIKNFEMIKVLGRGSLGQVILVKHKETNKVYAMKSAQKPMTNDEKIKEQIISERHLLLSLKHPFIVTLQYSFQTRHKLFFIFDYLKGGTLK